MEHYSPLVLVVDDEHYMLTVLRRILEQEHYRVITTANGWKALDIIEANKPDVILLDLMMPGIDGREVCRKAREISAKTQIIYFSAKAEPIDAIRLKKIRGEADAFISKPANSKQILSGISRVLHSADKY